MAARQEREESGPRHVTPPPLFLRGSHASFLPTLFTCFVSSVKSSCQREKKHARRGKPASPILKGTFPPSFPSVASQKNTCFVSLFSIFWPRPLSAPKSPSGIDPLDISAQKKEEEAVAVADGECLACHLIDVGHFNPSPFPPSQSFHHGRQDLGKGPRKKWA